MLFLKYFRAEPTEYARLSVNGKTIKEGAGVSSLYVPFRTSIEVVGLNVTEKPFGFREISRDNQEVTLQGGLLYRISDPPLAFGEYNFSLNPDTKQYRSDGHTKLPDHMLEIARGSARAVVQSTRLEDLLGMSEQLAAKVEADLRESRLIAGLGIEVKTVFFNAPQAQPDIAKALGAVYRENLLQQADAASYERRAQAVAQERAIQENQLGNQISLEQQRKELIDLEGQNLKTKAEFDAQAASLDLGVYETLSPDKIAALALYHIGKGNSNVESISITPELLAAFQNMRPR